MREIEFRAWDKQNKQMRYNTIPNSCNYLNYAICDAMNKYGLELMQYTGLNDKNGKQIYDGDLCKDEYGDLYQILWSEKHQWACKLIKTNYTLSKGLIFPLWHYDSCKENGYRQLEVIGNIYENPELLEVRNAE